MAILWAPHSIPGEASPLDFNGNFEINGSFGQKNI